MEKHFQLQGKTAEGRPLIHLVEPGTRYGLGVSAGLEKVAGGEHLPQVVELIESIQAQPNRLYLVNSALGAGEWVGFNLRGDWFTERGLVHEPRGWSKIPVWDIEARRRAASETDSAGQWGQLAWGYPTFYNAHRFRHHVNKDPERAYGYILGAFWDPRMRRVVLVSELVRDLCVKLGAADLYDRIAGGEFPDTSMGAKVPYDRCFPAGTLVRTSRGFRPIETCGQEVEVVTKDGHVRRVDVPLYNHYTGDLVTVKPAGLPEIEATANHPFFALRAADVRSCLGSANGKKRRHTPGPDGTCLFCKQGLDWTPRQVDAEALGVGDYLLVPTQALGSYAPNPALSYLLGVYAGDGFVVRQRTGRKKDGPYRDMGIGFSCNEGDPHVDYLLALLDIEAKNEPREYAEGEGKKAVSIRVYDQSLAARFIEILGEKWDGKGLKCGVFHDQESRLHFLAGCIDSDGCFDVETGSCRITSANRALAYDIWQTCVSSGIAASIGTQRSTGGYSDTDVWVVFIPGSYSMLLSHYSKKVQEVPHAKGTQSFFWRDFLCVPIKNISSREVEDLLVFNLDVEGDDETYTAGGVAVHNCSICNHVARSPADYCLHVRQGAMPPYGMRAILPDGRMCGVYNDYPRFFDDSYVFIGAERSAKVMANVTTMVRGNRAYTNRLFQPGGAPLEMREVVADVPYDERTARLGEAVANVLNSRVRGPTESRVGEHISQALATLPAPRVDAEARAMQHAQEVARRRAAVKDRTMSSDEYRFWENKASGDLENVGTTSLQRDRAIALLNSRLDNLAGSEKLGTLAKWATLTKQIPVPSSMQSALLRDHVGRLSPVLPQQVRDGLSRSVEHEDVMLSSLAHLGIVMRPEEFQGSYLRARGLGSLADDLDASGSCFERTPLDPYHEAQWWPTPPDADEISRLVRSLGDVLRGRSFAPRIVAIRISSPPQIHAVRARVTVSDPLLDQVSQAYNEYRTGLLTRPPDWRYVPAVHVPSTDTKIAEAASAVSDLLLHLAYW